MADVSTQPCSQAGCSEKATYTYVWHKRQYACERHMQGTLRIADAIGFPTVRNTTEHSPEGFPKQPEVLDATRR